MYYYTRYNIADVTMEKADVPCPVPLQARVHIWRQKCSGFKSCIKNSVSYTRMHYM